MDTPTKQFVKEVLTGKNQFTFSFGTDCLYAINIKRGKSRFIYGCYSCNLDSCTDVDKLTLHLLAIVKDKWVYLSESVLFKVYTEEDKKKLPENVMMLRDYQQLWKKRQEKLVNDYLTQFLRYESLCFFIHHFWRVYKIYFHWKARIPSLMSQWLFMSIYR